MTGRAKGNLSGGRHNVYADNGCLNVREFGYDGPCLECPLETCLEDIPTNIRQMKAAPRNTGIKHDVAAGMSHEAICSKYGLTRRQIQRILGGY